MTDNRIANHLEINSKHYVETVQTIYEVNPHNGDLRELDPDSDEYYNVDVAIFEAYFPKESCCD